MRKFLALIALCFFSSTTAWVYFKPFACANWIQTYKHHEKIPDFYTGYNIGGSLGYKCHCGLQLETEYAFRRNTLERFYYYGKKFQIPGHFQSSSYMLNAIWDLPLKWRCLNPFVGAGIGYDVQQIHVHDSGGFDWDKSIKGFAWQLMAGLSYPLTSRSDLTLEYKFHQGRASYIYSHALCIGFCYRFGARGCP